MVGRTPLEEKAHKIYSEAVVLATDTHGDHVDVLGMALRHPEARDNLQIQDLLREIHRSSAPLDD